MVDQLAKGRKLLASSVQEEADRCGGASECRQMFDIFQDGHMSSTSYQAVVTGQVSKIWLSQYLPLPASKGRAAGADQQRMHALCTLTQLRRLRRGSGQQFRCDETYPCSGQLPAAYLRTCGAASGCALAQLTWQQQDTIQPWTGHDRKIFYASHVTCRLPCKLAPCVRAGCCSVPLAYEQPSGPKQNGQLPGR